MRCPVDETTLVISERSGVEIDYCPQCRGVWLDRGELDKVIDRAGRYDDDDDDRPRRRDDSHGRDESYRRETKHRKRKDFLSELFEFGG